MYDDDEEQEEGPKCSFTTYLAEGDVLFKQGEYKKALDSYNLALELQPTEKFALVARSRCHLQLGDTVSALKDAETALEDDKEFIRALYQKAEALYSMGDFEHALVFYHRGNKLRPEQQEFRLGIQKAQEAIDNSIGRTAKIKLENKGDLSFFAKQDEVKKPKGYTKPKAAARTQQQQQQTNRGKNIKSEATSTRTNKQLLGELYRDFEYLRKLANDDDLVGISKLANEGFKFLNERQDFWRQQKPLYARKKEKPSRNKAKAKPKTTNHADYIVRSLEEIDQKLADGDEEGSLRQAENTLRKVKELNDKDIPNKQEVIANLHSCIGNAYLEMDNVNKALESHKRDLTVSKKIESKDGISRAFDNIGRCHARLGNYAEAIDSWSEKLPLSKTPLETTWLHHEIGRCYLELKNYQDALECGQKSLTSAQQAGEQIWQLNATVLIAQAQVKLGDVRAALDSFHNAHDIAKLLEDSAATVAVAKAIDDVNDRIAKDEREGNTSGKEEGDEKDDKRNERNSDEEYVEKQYEVNDDFEDDPVRENDDVEPDVARDDVETDDVENDDTKDNVQSAGDPIEPTDREYVVVGAEDATVSEEATKDAENTTKDTEYTTKESDNNPKDATVTTQDTDDTTKDTENSTNVTDPVTKDSDDTATNDAQETAKDDPTATTTKDSAD